MKCKNKKLGLRAKLQNTTVGRVAKATVFTAQTLILVAAAIVGKAFSAELPNVALPQPQVQTLDYGLKATALNPQQNGEGWYVITGQNADFSIPNGCNIINTGFYVGADKVWVINTGTSRLYGEQQLALIKQISSNKPIAQVIALNLHPDYFLGNQAYPKQALAATRETIAGIQREGKAYEDNLFKLCGDWMKATETVAPTQVLAADSLQGFDLQGANPLPLKVLELKGHTQSDLVLFDPKTGILWAGGLVFHNRIVTTPHATIKPWLESLQTLRALNPKVIVPSHGPVATGVQAIDQTMDYLRWLDSQLSQSAAQGLTINEVMQAGAPERFRGFAAYPAEFNRNVTHLYPGYEKSALLGQ